MEPDPSPIAPPLLAWYDRHGRTLPWRGIGDPWAIWVSEIMLQQTRIETGLKHWDRFIGRFPTVQSMAAATEEEVLAAWSGLGFYRRARNLHRGAQTVVAEHGGVVPRDPTELGALPGVGRYTVGAILSAAWDDPLPILDGNVIRVLSRLFGVDGPIEKAATKKELWRLAEAVLPGDRVGDFNQALMDFGSQHCKPRNPKCDGCPLGEQCVARATNRVDELPRPPRKAKVVHERRVALFVERGDGAFVLEQRPAGGLLGGLWQPPSATVAIDDAATLAGLLAGLGLTVGATPRRGGDAEHRFSHRHWSIATWAVAVQEATLGERQAWFRLDELDGIGLPTASRKALDAARRPQLSLL